jgi:hypothetical protein
MVSCYAKRRLLPDSFSGGLNCLLNTCDFSASVVGSGRSLPTSINSLLAPLFSSLILRSSAAFFSPSLLLHPTMGKGRRGQGSPRRAGDKRKRDPSPPSEDSGDSEYSEEVSSDSEGSLALASPPASSDDSDDSQGLAAEVWTYIRSVERAGLKGSDESKAFNVEACQKAFNNVCAFIGTRDLVQEHIAYRVWPLVNDWEMSKETAAGSNQGGLVYLKYTFRYKDQFEEPNDDWLTCVEATSDELLGAYTRAEDDAMTLAFGGRGKKRLNRVFDVIGFVYPDYTYPSRKQGKKRITTTSPISATPKGKNIKV